MARQLREQALVESHARFVWPPRGFPGGIEPDRTGIEAAPDRMKPGAGFQGRGGVRGPGRQKKARIEMEYSVSVRVSPSSGEADHIETVPADGEEDAVMLREIIETHLRARRAGRRCPDSDWLHRMMLDRGCSCPCKTPHSRAVVAVEQPAAPGGDWYPANPSHNDDHPTCCICMTSVDPAGARRLPCSHAFHPECLARCLQHSALCPLCKMSAE